MKNEKNVTKNRRVQRRFHSTKHATWTTVQYNQARENFFVQVNRKCQKKITMLPRPASTCHLNTSVCVFYDASFHSVLVDDSASGMCCFHNEQHWEHAKSSTCIVYISAQKEKPTGRKTMMNSMSTIYR
ncbi:hypothetical protein MRX96_041093 [Rhipicephalus microplus]